MFSSFFVASVECELNIWQDYPLLTLMSTETSLISSLLVKARQMEKCYAPIV